MSAKAAALEPIFAQLFRASPGKGELRRQRVLEAAITVLAARGLEGLSHESIGKGCAMRRSHVAYYFPTISSVIESAVKYVSATAQGVTVAGLTAAADPAARLIAYVEANFRWAEKHPAHAAFMMHFYSLCTHRKPYRELHLRVREAGRGRVLALLGELPAKAASRVALRQAAETIQALITSNLIEHLTGGTADSLERIRRRTVSQAMAVATSVRGLEGVFDQAT